MSLKSFFDSKGGKQAPLKSNTEIKAQTGFQRHIIAEELEQKTFIPTVDFTDPGNFARFGSAKDYYTIALKNIQSSYPYDGSYEEKINWKLDSTPLERHIYDNEYPRTNGYISLAVTGAGSAITTVTNSNHKHRLHSVKEYVLVNGGMKKDSDSTNLKKLFNSFDGKSNSYEEGDLRSDSSLSFGGTSGSCVEFWMKKPAGMYNSGQEVILDIWNSSSFSSSDYARLSVFYCKRNSGPIGFGIVSGSTKSAFRFSGSSAPTNSDVTDGQWHHYAINFNDTSAELYFDGKYKDSVNISSINRITGSVASIGSYRYWYSNDEDQAQLGGGSYNVYGWSKISASFDEFRYWKKSRTREEIGRFWNDNVQGGANSEHGNIGLGFYYKFNEGIVNTGSADSRDTSVMDYSGRITNGTWVGYSSPTQRNTNSAIVESSASAVEDKDPIIYPYSHRVSDYNASLLASGSKHDDQNNSMLFNTLPEWIQEEDTGHLNQIFQIFSSYFDTVYNQVKHVSQIKDKTYISSSQRPIYFTDKLLKNQGFQTHDIFLESTLLEDFLSRSETEVYEDKVFNLKNKILKNLYNNLAYIYKSKGTEKSVDNFLRIFGAHPDIISLNSYSMDSEYEILNTKRDSSLKKRFLRFGSEKEYSASIFSFNSGSQTNVSDILAASTHGKTYGNTFEYEVVFPDKLNKDSPFYSPTTFATASIAGVRGTHPLPAGTTTWLEHQNDSGSFDLKVARPGLHTKDAKFSLSSSHFGLTLTSSVYKEVYNDSKWNFSITVKPSNYPLMNIVSGASDSSNYELGFYGINTLGDYTVNEFYLTQSVTKTKAEQFLASSKRLYAGASKTNFTGSVIFYSDVDIGAVRYYDKFLANSDIKNHSIDMKNIGILEASNQNFQSSEGKQNFKSLSLHWQFPLVTGSDSNGQFSGIDISSGSANSQLGTLDAKHNFMGTGFSANSSNFCKKRTFNTLRENIFDIVNSSRTVRVLKTDDEYFSKKLEVSKTLAALEKSPYQVISREALALLSSAEEYNNLIGDPTDRYRQEYSALSLFKRTFFRTIENDIDIEKYFEFYKWMDDSLLTFVEQLVPASMEILDSPVNVIESHILERNKYRHKLPLLDNITDQYSGSFSNDVHGTWVNNHAPLSNLQNQNCSWWRTRAERANPTLSSGNSSVDTQKQSYLQQPAASSAIDERLENRQTNSFKLEKVVSLNEEIRNPGYVKNRVSFAKNDYLLIRRNSIESLEDCQDNKDLKIKVKLDFSIE